MKNVQNKQPNTPNQKQNKPEQERKLQEQDYKPEEPQSKQLPGEQPDIDQYTDETQPDAVTNRDQAITNKQSQTFEQDIETARESDPERRAPIGEDPNEIAELENLDDNQDETAQDRNKPL